MFRPEVVISPRFARSNGYLLQILYTGDQFYGKWKENSLAFTFLLENIDVSKFISSDIKVKDIETDLTSAQNIPAFFMKNLCTLMLRLQCQKTEHCIDKSHQVKRVGCCQPTSR